MTALEWVQRSKIIAIVRGLPKEYMTRLAEALYAGGIDLMEVTFHQQKPETRKDTAAAIAAAPSRVISGFFTSVPPYMIQLAARP